MIKYRKANGDIIQATPILETETTFLIRDNFKDVFDEDGVKIDNQVSYDEYVMKKDYFQTIKRLALGNQTPLDEIETVVFRIIREEHEVKEDD